MVVQCLQAQFREPPMHEARGPILQRCRRLRTVRRGNHAFLRLRGTRRRRTRGPRPGGPRVGETAAGTVVPFRLFMGRVRGGGPCCQSHRMRKGRCPPPWCSLSRCFFSRAPGEHSLSLHLIRWLTRTPCVASWICR